MGAPLLRRLSPNGSRVASSYDGGTIVVADVRSGTTQISIHMPKGVPLDVAFAPDGRTLAVATGMSDNHLYLLKAPSST
jgi:WD40 repeat protein